MMMAYESLCRTALCPLCHFQVFWALRLVLLEFELVHDVVEKLTTRHVLHHLSVKRPEPGLA